MTNIALLCKWNTGQWWDVSMVIWHIPNRGHGITSSCFAIHTYSVWSLLAPCCELSWRAPCRYFYVSVCLLVLSSLLLFFCWSYSASQSTAKTCWWNVMHSMVKCLSTSVSPLMWFYLVKKLWLGRIWGSFASIICNRAQSSKWSATSYQHSKSFTT